MTVESALTIEIATVSDWLKKISRQFFIQWEAKPKRIAPYTRDFSRALSKLQVICRDSDGFIVLLLARVVIGWSNNFGIGFSTVIWKPNTY